MFSVLLLITYTLAVQLNITLFEVSPHPPNRIVFKTFYPPKGRAERTQWGPLDSLSNLICV